MTTARHLFAAALLGAALASSVHADPGVSMAWSYRDFTTWQLFGTATAQNDVPGNGFMHSNLVLMAPASHDAAGAGFAPGALALDFNQTFSFDFHFFIPASQDTRGDGLTFTLTDATGVGNGGSGLGYEGLSGRRVALAIDTFHFDGQPVSPSLQLLSGGSVTPLAATETGLGDAIRGSPYQWYAALHYTPSGNGDNTGLLTGTLENLDHGSFSVSAAVDFDALGLVGVPVFYGFTAANGLATDGHFVTSAMPVPEPGRYGTSWTAANARERTGMQRPINDTPMERMSADEFLRQELDRLAPALHGFPMEPLVSAFTSAAATERRGAARLVEHCLGGWIASLDATLDGYTDNLGDALQHVQGRQRAARNALATLKTALSRVELDHARGG